jgi:hypothetical protein
MDSSVPAADQKAATTDEFKDYAVAYSSATKTKLDRIIGYYSGLEGIAWFYYVILVLVIWFSEIDSFRRLRIVSWYALKALYPISWMLVVFFLGPPPYKLKDLQSTRHSVHLVFTLATSLASIGSGIAFIVIQSIYVASNECRIDPASLCQNATAAFVFLIVLCAALICVEILVIVTTATSFIEKKKEN